MRPSSMLCCLLLCLGCARSMEPRERSGLPEDSGTLSAAVAAAPQDAGKPQAAAECRGDEDCALTLVPEGDCCPMLCTGRAVTAAEAGRLDARQRECDARTPCPAPACARPRNRAVAVCTAGRCETRHVPMEVP
jgi:hypothetical protein